MRPRVLMKRMRIELFLLSFGVGCALFLPFYLKSISRKRHENRKLDLEEAYAKTNFNHDQSLHNHLFSDRGGVIKVDEADGVSLSQEAEDQEMMDFMVQVQAADAMARERDFDERAGQRSR